MNQKIMIVDDEEDILTALKTFFEQHQFDVTTVSKGKDCIKQIEQGFKGIVFIDIMMPKMDGWETINQIVKRGYEKNVAIKIITGKGTRDHDKIMLLAPYISDYISKPFDEKTLLNSVSRSMKNT